MRNVALALLLGLTLAACKEKEDPEVKGNDFLYRARLELNAGNYEEARQLVKQMREEVPLALNARESGILLMDSINLAEAQEQLRVRDSLIQVTENPDRLARDTMQARFDEACQKVKFYHRKLQHDRKNKKQH